MKRDTMSTVASDRCILVKGAAGLGNRLLSALSAVLYARVTNRAVHIDWRDHLYSDGNSNAFPMLFQGRQRNLVTDLPETDSVWPMVWTGRLDEPLRSVVRSISQGRPLGPAAWKATSTSLSRVDHEETVLVTWAYTEQVWRLRRHLRPLEPQFRTMRTDDILRQLLREELEPVAPLRERVESFRAAHFDRPVVGIHARRSDKESALPRIATRLRKLLAGNPALRVFLATDSQELLRDFRREYPDVVTTDKWYPPPGLPMHRWSDCPDRVQLGQDAVVDLYLLAACDYLVTDEHSTFAQVAHLLSDAPASHIWNVNRRLRAPSPLRYFVWAQRKRAQLLVRALTSKRPLPTPRSANVR